MGSYRNLCRFVPFKTLFQARQTRSTGEEHRFTERFVRGTRELRILIPDTLMSRQNGKASQEFGSDVIFQFLSTQKSE